VEEQFWSLCVAKGITVISRAKSSEQNDDKTNNSDDVILRQFSISCNDMAHTILHPDSLHSSAECYLGCKLLSAFLTTVLPSSRNTSWYKLSASFWRRISMFLQSRFRYRSIWISIPPLTEQLKQGRISYVRYSTLAKYQHLEAIEGSRSKMDWGLLWCYN